MPDVLPDLLALGLRVVFCGSAAGPVSARVGAYYAGPGNRFWPVLHEAGFTPRRLCPAAYPELIGHGIGLTDLAKSISGVDSALRPADLDVMRLILMLDRYRPAALAFTSRFAGAAFLGARAVQGFGEQPGRPGLPRLFVLPSPSGQNAHWPAQRHHWREAAVALGFA